LGLYVYITKKFEWINEKIVILKWLINIVAKSYLIINNFGLKKMKKKDRNAYRERKRVCVVFQKK
jgi:hypothetical protein